jgi:hypothetical protein
VSPVSEPAEELDEAYRERVLASYRALCDREHVRQLKDAEIARRMVELDPELKTGYQQAGRLLNGVRSRHRPTMVAFARVLGVDPGWLDYGAASAAPAPTFASPFTVPAAAPSVPKVAPKPIARARAEAAKKKQGRRSS